MRGQTEMILIVPLLLIVITLNFLVFQNLDQTDMELNALMRDYNDLVFGQSFMKDPTTGNIYPARS